MVALEYVFQFRPDHLVQPLHIVGADALAVGRVGDDGAVGRSFVPGRQGLGFQLDHTAYAGALDVACGDFDGFWGDVGAIDFHIDVALVGVVVVEAVEQGGIEILPVFKGEMLAVDAGVDVGGDQGGLDQKSAGAAHGVDERSVAFPAAFENYSGGKHLIDRGFGLSDEVAALMERLAGGVERQSDVFA